MFGIGWSELLLIGVIVLFAFGPEDIPKIMYNLGRVVRRLHYIRYALSAQFEDFMEKSEHAARPRAEHAHDVHDAHDRHAPNHEADDDAALLAMMPLPPPSADELPHIDHDDDRPDDTAPGSGDGTGAGTPPRA
ncbi:MAG: twin-arginine translocase TatA/TatE family subunit [Rhodospirillales bacterium]|nr:twin-arginine translocase TatA/TatE family subunit [Alphaproteobacteria bacterium]MCB9987590.1 twin-arginine translocase TatA/TatE family subunit [Rhodospirillales bacterium]USO07694.1 MAG: twin-arginine translocase TatA/TatE family subunit [Rhodospirillales bacterium]